LPGRVLVVVASTDVLLGEWSQLGQPRLLAQWPAKSFSAELIPYEGQIAVRVVLESGLIAVLAASRNPLRRTVRHALHAVFALGS
jgi:hypothetical protein